MDQNLSSSRTQMPPITVKRMTRVTVDLEMSDGTTQTLVYDVDSPDQSIEHTIESEYCYSGHPQTRNLVRMTDPFTKVNLRFRTHDYKLKKKKQKRYL